jgi:hypothetical protein
MRLKLVYHYVRLLVVLTARASRRRAPSPGADVVRAEPAGSHP